MNLSSDFRDLLHALSAARVRFLVVGGYAVIHHTEPRFTKDLDVWIPPTAANAARLIKALRAFGAPSEGCLPCSAQVGARPRQPMWSPILCARVALRDLREPDLEAFSAYRSDPVVARYQSFSPPFTLDDARAFLAGIQATTFGAAGTWYQIAIADKETDSLLGDLAVHFLEEEDQVEIGFTLARASQGRGIAREALRALVDHLFGPMAKRRATALTDARNEGAIRLLTSLGFRQEAHYRQNAFFKGAYCDELLFACLRSEWPGQAGA